MMYNEIMKNKVFIISLVTIFVCLLFTGCASNGSIKGNSSKELESQPALFADWKYKGFGQEYPLWAEAVVKRDLERAAELLGLPYLSEEAVVYRTDLYYGENLDLLLKYENPEDQQLIKDTWCYIDPYYEEYEDRYVYITLRRAQGPQLDTQGPQLDTQGPQGMEE